jgi:hypothetical protein
VRTAVNRDRAKPDSQSVLLLTPTSVWRVKSHNLVDRENHKKPQTKKNGPVLGFPSVWAFARG